MSSGIMPNYNAGKFIGEIQWLEPISVSSSTSKSNPEVYSDDIVITVNRCEVNEIYLCIKAIYGSSKITYTKKDIDIFFSSETNLKNYNLLAFLRNGEIGAELRLSGDGGYNNYIIDLVSEQSDSFIIKLGYKYSTSSSYYANACFLIGWR